MRNFNIRLEYPLHIVGEIQLNKGCLTLLEGPTGSGKTTILYELMRQTQGKYVYLSQQYKAYDELSIKDNFEIFSIPEKVMREYMNLFDLNVDTCSILGHLSGGEKQRVVLAISMARAPEYLYLDEPISHVDLNTRKIIMDAIKAYCHHTNSYVLIVNHTLEFNEYCDALYVLEENQIVQQKLGEEQLNTDARQYQFKIRKYISKDIRNNKLNCVILSILITLLLLCSVIGNLTKKVILSQLNNDLSSYVVINAENIESVERLDLFESLSAYPAVTCDYNGESGMIYPLIGDVSFIQYESSEGLYTVDSIAQKYDINIGDIVFTDQNYYSVTGIIEDSYIEPLVSNAKIVFYKNELEESTNTYVGKLKDVMNYEESFNSISKLDDVYSISFGNSYSQMIIEYKVNMINLVQNLSKIGYLILFVIDFLITNRIFKQHIDEYYYMKCHSIPLSRLVISFCSYLWCYQLLVSILLFIIIRKYYLINMLIALIPLVISLYYLNNQKLFYKSIRGNE